jgi:hypothetical protein
VDGSISFLDVYMVCAQIMMDSLHVRVILGEGIVVILQHFHWALSLLFSQPQIDVQSSFRDGFYSFLGRPLVLFS